MSQVLWIVLQWTWACRCLFNTLMSAPLIIYPEVRILGHGVVLFSMFWGSSRLFSVVLVLTYIPANSASEFLFHAFLDNSHSNSERRYLIVVLIFISWILWTLISSLISLISWLLRNVLFNLQVLCSFCGFFCSWFLAKFHRDLIVGRGLFRSFVFV